MFRRTHARGSPSRDVAANLIGLGVAGAAGVLLLLLIALLHGPEALGRFNLLFAVHLIGAQVATLGLHVSAVRYLAPLSDDPERRSPVLRGAVLATLVSAGTAAGLLWVARGALAALLGRPGLEGALGWVALGILLFALNKVLLAALTGLGRLGLHAALTATRGVLLLASLGLLTVLGYVGEELVLVLVITEAALLVPLLAAHAGDLFGRGGSRSRGRSWVATHLRFGVLGAGSSLLTEINVRVDVLVLAAFVDDRAIGIYTLAATLAEAALQVPMVYRTVLGPTVVRLLALGDASGLATLVRTTRVRLWGGMAALSALTIGIVPLVIVGAGLDSDFVDGRAVLAVLLVGVVVASGYVPFGLLLAHGGQPLAQTGFVAGLVVLNLVGNLLLIPTFGLLGAATATAVTNVVSVPLLRSVARRRLAVAI